MVAKTGQALIASHVFQSLPDAATKEEEKEVSTMEVDPAPTSTTATTGESPASPTATVKPFSPPLDAKTNDLLPEGTAYIRLLLILANIDAGHVQEVSVLVVRARMGGN
jgi:hypothetical protein